MWMGRTFSRHGIRLVGKCDWSDDGSDTIPNYSHFKNATPNSSHPCNFKPGIARSDFDPAVNTF